MKTDKCLYLVNKFTQFETSKIIIQKHYGNMKSITQGKFLIKISLSVLFSATKKWMVTLFHFNSKLFLWCDFSEPKKFFVPSILSVARSLLVGIKISCPSSNLLFLNLNILFYVRRKLINGSHKSTSEHQNFRFCCAKLFNIN